MASANPGTSSARLSDEALSQPSSPTACCGLGLAVASDSAPAIQALLAAMPASARQAAAARAAGKWQPGAGCDAAALGLLLAAGADPLALLPRLLLRYDWSVQVSRAQSVVVLCGSALPTRTSPGVHPLHPSRQAIMCPVAGVPSCAAHYASAVQVAQLHPFHEQPNGWRAGLAACLAHPACEPERPHASEHRCQLLLAAICCRDAALCSRLIQGAGDGCWGRHANNCHLLVAAAEHDLAAVLSALLDVCTACGGQPFSPAMAHEGCSPLAAAAERNSCGALQLLLQRGADVHAAGPDGLAPLHWAVIGGACEAAELLLLAGARWVRRGRLAWERARCSRQWSVCESCINVAGTAPPAEVFLLP